MIQPIERGYGNDGLCQLFVPMEPVALAPVSESPGTYCITIRGRDMPCLMLV